MAEEFGRYEPIALPFSQTVESEVLGAIERELRAIANAMLTPSTTASRYEPQMSEPIVYEGLVAIADGDGWDPGAGPGVYVYLNGEWVFVGGYPTTSFLWKDEKGSITVQPTSGNPPTFAAYRGNIYQYRFANAVLVSEEQVFINFHIDHDYAPGTPAYYHLHPSCTDAVPAGDVYWGIEYTVAKGHNQEAFGAPTTEYLTTSFGSIPQYQHLITETSLANAIPATHLEPDSLVLMRVWRHSSNAADTCTSGNIFLHFADLHYNIDRPGTPGKAPDFYA